MYEIIDSLPEFQETKNFTLQGKEEDCQTSNKGEEDKTTKDKVNNNIQTPEEETVLQEKRSDLSENLNIESKSLSLTINEDQLEGNHTKLK